MKYRGYIIKKEQDHVIVIGDRETWREDTYSDAVQTINRQKGSCCEEYNTGARPKPYVIDADPVRRFEEDR